MADIIEAGILIDGLHPIVKVQGSRQRIVFGLGDAPEPSGMYDIDNIIAPTEANPTKLGYRLRNNTFSGYGFEQNTAVGDTYGTYGLKRYLNNSSTGESIFDISDDGSVDFQTPVVFNNNVSFNNLNFPKLGIGVDPTDNGIIEFFPSDFTAKIIFARGSPANAYNVSGIGYLSSVGTTYNTFVGKNHTFFNGALGSLSLSITPTELKLGYGLSSIDFRKLSFYEIADNPHQTIGVGVDLASSPTRKRLRSQVSTTVDEFSWFFGESSSSSTEKMTLGYNQLSLKTSLDMGGFEVKNALDPIAAQSLVTRIYMENYVSSAIDSNFGPDVALPFVQLNYNWNNAASSDPFIVNHSLTNSSAFIKQFISRIGSTKATGLGAGTRKWDWFYDLGDPTEPYGEARLEFSHPLATTMVPFKIITNPLLGTPINIYLTGVLNMTGNIAMGLNKITGLADAFDNNDAVSKGFMNTTLNNANVNLTGSVTGTGKVNGTGGTAVITSFAATQTVSGSTQTFQFNNAAAAFVLNNTNVAPTTTSEYWISRNGVAGLKIGIIGDSPANRVSYINSIGGAPLYFQSDGTTRAYMSSAGSLVLGSLTSPLSKLDIYGGIQNVANEDSCLRLISSSNSTKLELQNTTANKLFEIRVSNTGVFDITNRTASITLYSIDVNNNHIFNTVSTLFAKMPKGYLSMSGNATGVATIAATWQKIPGTTILGATSNLFDMPVNNRLRYTGTPTLPNINIAVSLTFTYASSVTTKLGFSIFKNGTLLSDSPKYVSNTTTNLSMFVGLTVSTSFATNDYIEIFFQSPNAGVTITGTDLSITTQQ